VPLGREQYDLVIPRQHYESPLLSPLLEITRERTFQQVVQAMGGYDVSRMGQVVSET
jgi:putative molybdopterin biosynthesis protein